MKIGSLFSGIGGLELGLENAGLGETIWQAENNPFCQQVLRRHWPGAQLFPSVEAVAGEVPYVDLICGGFPCQDISPAGKRGGLSGKKSGLWAEFRRIVGLVRPSWLVIENSYAGWRRWVPAVRRQLWALGFTSVCIRVRAAEVGLPHRRSRGFLVAHTYGFGGGEPGHWRANTVFGADIGIPGFVANLDRAGKSQPEGPIRPQWRWACDSLEARGDGRTIKPGVGRGVYGIPRRLDRVGALGNAVVPACAELVGRLIKDTKQE